MKYFREDSRTAHAAKAEAQRLAFAPIAFQTSRLLLNSGILAAIRASGRLGLTLEAVAAKTKLPRYGVKVLLESGLGTGLFCLNDDRYTMAKLGHFILNDPMFRVNADFVHDVCFRGLYDLEKSVRNGIPAGLKTLGRWKTVYAGLSALSPKAQQSWFNFDHHYSDRAFPAALPLVFALPPKKLLDVGGNTGKWAVQCAQYNPQVQITIADLPRQLTFARKTIRQHKLQNRVAVYPIDVLAKSQPFPQGYDAIWMSQFLDCFGEEQIIAVLRRAARAMKKDATLYILEPFWDRQANETAANCLQQISLYFTCIANGSSQMYHSADLIRCLTQSGLKVVEEHDHVGEYHTLLKCRKV
ncbi:MAG: class I SAM-dependent methyltransferase [Verrucomicrobiae bacterium]|nr:class I SAM-dependent methyltransferase [Verrucomicrobiae bacterium]